ncbi:MULTISPECIES: DUF1707 SHOCT-like domain-containing protein [Pseudonocardia]|uniref:DUF1707 domain-containing protein n=2 Tax=Pseudonocardia TaxID=1847 RepID=A0A1Y2N4T8_PSEAH|nr:MULTISPECIES: DUF1707 domain-containing protein [Pseudonocardia]OSY42159.1 hypothetical protein BG845_01657 [Pseudonocardia autotrophica]TDN75073.1 uncharacterized protein DUF1707 [Pseudonocardia autotrophica]BBF99017.1 hypothetical protein Pdca_02270 [Pseudonocardia autotrophica]GEC23937.1 hypothetical protein PSA01_09660 [Pseudonocardia saturnea]
MDAPERPDGSVAPRDLRVSHSDRAHISALLDRHHVDGRLDGAELAERLVLVTAAVTRADLNRVVADLPGAAEAVPVREVLELTNTAGELRRSGEWLVPPRVVVRSYFGNARLDMRRARFVTGDVVIESELTVGNLDIRLPPGATVDLTGARTQFGSVRDKLGATDRPGAPHVVVVGGTWFGNITVR